MDQIRNRKQLILSIAILCLYLFLEGVLIAGARYYIGREAEKMKERAFLIDSERENKNDAGAVAAAFDKIQPLLPVFASALPNEDSIINALDQIVLKSREFGYRVSVNLESQSTTPTDIPGVRAIAVSFSVEANYSALRQYLALLSNLPLFIEISSFSLKGPSIMERGTAQIRGRIFIR